MATSKRDALSTFAAAARQDLTARLCAHPAAESVLAFAYYLSGCFQVFFHVVFLLTICWPGFSVGERAGSLASI